MTAARAWRGRVGALAQAGKALVITSWALAPGVAAAEPEVSVSPACAPLLQSPVDHAALQAAIEAGADPDATCPVTRMVRRRLSFLEVMLGAIIPPIGLMMVLDDRRTPSTRMVPLLTLALGQRSDPAVRGLLAAGADPLRMDPRGVLPLRAAVVADLDGDGARWTHLVLGDRTLPPLSLCNDISLLDQLWDHPTLRIRLEGAGLGEQGRDCDGRNWLHRAAQDGGGDRVGALLRAGVVGVDQRDQRGRTAVYLAARRDHWEVVAQLLAAGARVGDAGGEQGSLLHEAVESRQSELVATLLERRHPLDGVDESGRTALHLAAEGGDAETVRLLLGAGARPGADGREGGRVLAAAVGSGSEDAVRVLLGAGISPVQSTDWGRDLFDLAYAADALGIARALLDAGGRPHRDRSSLGHQDRQPLLTRVLFDGRADWEALLLPGAPADELEEALTDVVVRERRELAERLLAAGADGGWTLSFMESLQEEATALWLVEAGVRYPEDALDTMLPAASSAGVARALAGGASPLGSGREWAPSPVTMATRERRADVVGMLVAAGAPVPTTLWSNAIYDRDADWVAALAAAGVPAGFLELRAAVRSGRTALVAPLVAIVSLTPRERRRLRVRAWWTQAPPALRALLRPAKPAPASP